MSHRHIRGMQVMPGWVFFNCIGFLGMLTRPFTGCGHGYGSEPHWHQVSTGGCRLLCMYLVVYYHRCRLLMHPSRSLTV